jgi:hypothetical protein
MGAMAATPAPPLLERDGDLEELAAARRDASIGRGRFVIVEGRAGMGKSALLTVTRMAALENGFDTLAARASELERQYPSGWFANSSVGACDGHPNGSTAPRRPPARRWTLPLAMAVRSVSTMSRSPFSTACTGSR